MKPGGKNPPGDSLIEKNSLPSKRDHHELQGKENTRAHQAQQNMHPPAPANESGLKAVSEEPEKHEDDNRPSQRDFNMTVDDVQVREVC